MSELRFPPALGCLLALAAGVLTTLTASPFELWWLGPVAVGLVYLGIHALTPGQAALRGWCYGLGLFGSGASWVYVSIHDYGYTGVPLAVFLTALFVADGVADGGAGGDHGRLARGSRGHGGHRQVEEGDGAAQQALQGQVLAEGHQVLLAVLPLGIAQADHAVEVAPLGLPLQDPGEQGRLRCQVGLDPLEDGA